MRRSIEVRSDLETNPLVELEGRAVMTTTRMRGAVLADIGRLVVVERDAPVRWNETILNAAACGGVGGTDLRTYASEGLGVVR